MGSALAAVLVLTLDQAQLAPQVLAAGRQAAVVLQQLAVVLEEAGRHLLLLLLLLQITREFLPERRPSAGQETPVQSSAPHPDLLLVQNHQQILPEAPLVP